MGVWGDEFFDACFGLEGLLFGLVEVVCEKLCLSGFVEMV